MTRIIKCCQSISVRIQYEIKFSKPRPRHNNGKTAALMLFLRTLNVRMD